MRAVVDFGQMLEVEVSVDLGGTDVAVAEQFLYSSDILAGFQHVTGEGMAQHVRVYMFGQIEF